MNFHQVEFYKSFAKKNQLPESNHLEFVFSGRSNVGKSSLINRLFHRKGLARVSSMPGKTATINFFRLENVDFVDLPGYGYAKVSKTEKQKWADLIEGYFHGERNIGLVFQLIDIRHAPSKDDCNMVNFLIEMEFPFVIVLTKADKLNVGEYQKRMEEIPKELPMGEELTFFPISSTKSTGMEALVEVMEEIVQEEALAEEAALAEISEETGEATQEENIIEEGMG